MTTLTRTNSQAKPGYKDYVNFLGSYRGGKAKDDQSSDSGISERNFPLSNSSNSTSSSSLNSDVTDFAKPSCVSYNNYLETAKNKKFNSVKPPLEDGTLKRTMRSEIYIEVQNATPTATSVSDAAKKIELTLVVDENKSAQQPKNGGIGHKINIFEKQTEQKKDAPTFINKQSVARQLAKKLENRVALSNTTNKAPTPPPPSPGSDNRPKISEKPTLVHNTTQKRSTVTVNGAPPPPPPPMMMVHNTSKKIEINPPPPPMMVVNNFSKKEEDLPPPSVMVVNNSHKKFETHLPPPPPVMVVQTSLPLKTSEAPCNGVPPPPPPMMPHNFVPPKTFTTVVPQNNGRVVNNGVNLKNSGAPLANSNHIDRNNPMVRKLVYGTLRGMYGAYHEKANDFVATLPRNMVKKDNGVQSIIDHIAANGDLDKLNGRINPKQEQE